jgi:hypothetical protein
VALLAGGLEANTIGNDNRAVEVKGDENQICDYFGCGIQPWHRAGRSWVTAVLPSNGTGKLLYYLVFL